MFLRRVLSFFGVRDEPFHWLVEWLVILFLVFLYCSGFLEFGAEQVLPGSEAESFQLLDQVFLNSLSSFHQFPQWNFYILGGVSYVADPMLHVFNPVVSIPALVLGIHDGFKVALFLSFLLAAYGIWWLGKTIGMQSAGRLWVAGLFAFGGQPAIRFISGQYLFIFGYAWIPWALASLILAMQTQRRVYIALAALFLGLLFFSGNLYYPVLMLPTFGLLALVFVPRFLRKRPYLYFDSGKFKVLIVTGCLALGLIAVQAFPLFEFYPRMGKDMRPYGGHTLQQVVWDLTSDRINRPDTQFQLPTQEYYSYLGWGPVLAALFLPLAIWRHPNRKIILFFVVWLVFFILIINPGQTPWKNLYANTPFLAQFHLPTRALIYCCFAVIMLSGFGIDTIWRLSGDIPNRLLGHSQAFVTGWVRLFLSVLILMVIYSPFRVNQEHLKTQAPLPGLSQMMRKLRMSDPGLYYVDTIRNYPMSAVSNHLWTLNPWYHYKDLKNGEWDIKTRPVRAQPHYFIFGSNDEVLWPDPILVESVDVFTLYRLPNSLPFAFTIPYIRLYDLTDARDVSNEEVTPVDAQQTGANRLVVTTFAEEQPAILVILTHHYPGWNVTVDGRRGSLLRIWGFLGVELLPGRHTYQFEFRSAPFLVGAGISLFSLAVVIGLLADELKLRFKKS